MIDTVLWDVDGTLLNFKVAEKAAIKAMFKRFDLGECSDEMFSRYSQINDAFWRRLERNELSRKQILIQRFEQFFGEYGINKDLAEKFNEEYLQALGNTIVYNDDSLDIIKQLKGMIRQYVVSNGSIVAQTRKLKRSGLGELMDGVFLSEELGIEKPDVVFFEKVFSKIGIKDPSTVMIVGDSLTSDIKGGMNAGIKTCWYNPAKLPLPDGYRVDYTVSDLHEIVKLIINDRLSIAWKQ